MSTSNSSVTHPPIHVLVHGDPGSRKSTFAATFPKPLIVFFFDQVGMDLPYLRIGHPTELDVYPGKRFTYRDVLNDDGELLIRLQYFADMNPEKPEGFRNFLDRLQDFYHEYHAWATAVIDSVTMLELAARYNEKYFLNPKAKDPRQWWAGSTDALEQVLMSSFGAMPINVVVVAHCSEDKDEVNGTFVRTIRAPGRMSKGAAAGYSEVYRAYIPKERGPQGEPLYYLQTQPDGLWIAKTAINAPNPSWGDYECLWANE